MASARRTGTNENISTYGNGTRDYSALQIWEDDTDNDLVTSTTSEVLECYADSDFFIDFVSISGAITDASYMRIVRPASGEGHDGTPNSGVHFQDNFFATFQIYDDYTKLQDLVLSKPNGNDSGSLNGIYTFADEVEIVGLVIDSILNAGTNNGRGMLIDDHTGSCYVIDCVISNCKTHGILVSNTGGTVYVYNCTVINNGYGIRAQSGGCVARNCIADNNATADFSGAFFNAASNANACSDSSTVPSGVLTGRTFTFVDESSSDYHLAATDTGAFQQGLDLTSAAGFGFDDDIDGDTILVWSMGADAQASFISSRRYGVNENISTYGDGTRDYCSLSIWEMDTDTALTTSEVTEVLECYADSASFDDSTDLAGATANANYHRIIRAAPGEGHDGTPGTGVHFNRTTGTRGIELSEAFASLQDLVISLITNDASAAFAVLSATGGSNNLVTNCLVKATNSGAGDAHAITYSGGATAFSAINCLAYESDNSGFLLGSAGTITIYNCTAIDNDLGFDRNSGTVTCTNCLANGNTSGDFDGTITQSYNASGDATASGTGSRTSQTFTFVDDANDDYHLDPDDDGASNFGNDLSADSTFPFNDDIDNAEIETWSIGFDSDNVSTGYPPGHAYSHNIFNMTTIGFGRTWSN